MGKLLEIARFLALMLLAAAAVPVHARGSATMESCIAPILAGQSATQVIAQPQGFDCKTRQYDLAGRDYLVRLGFTPVAAAMQDPLILRMSSVWQDRTIVHFRYADGSVRSVSFSSRTASRYLTIGAMLEVQVPPSKELLTAAYVEVHGAANLRGVVVAPTLVTQNESAEQRLLLVMLYSAFVGMALALIAYNLSHWAALRHRFQLVYCAMVISLLAYCFSSTGAAMLLFPAMGNNERLRLNYVLLALVGVVAMQFVRHFFEAKVFGPMLRKAIIWISSAAMLASLIFAGAAPWHIWLLDRLYFVTMSALLALVFPVMISAWHHRSRHFWIFAITWSPPVIISAMRALHGFHLIGYSFWLDNGNIIAASAEALMSSVMVTLRLRDLSLERDHAREGEQVARRLANTDPLTGLLNRRAFLDLAIGRRARQRLMLIDIDHFKAVNDRLGHDGGDEVLRAVAGAIQSCRPSGSLAVRLGGEEFALLLPRAAFAECPADMVLEAVRHATMPRGVKVTVSLGYADGVVGDEEEWKRLYRLADAALYRAKSDGRDRSCRATDFRAVA